MASAETERQRLADEREIGAAWKKWGPYLSERQWGTVREDYSGSGDPWNGFPHDHARSRAYRWGEDGLAGISDDHQLLCFAPALWNRRDPIIKERLFGLGNAEGNHGEDVKEQYFYLDNTPTHSYMAYLYKYPQQPFPYEALIAGNRRRGKGEPEFEILDTGVFDEKRYFDVLIEYAKETPETILVRITVVNQGPANAPLDVLPTLWFRNTWAGDAGAGRPRLQRRSDGGAGQRAITALNAYLGERILYCEGAPELLFTDNDSNRRRLTGEANDGPFVKDAINDYLTGRPAALNPTQQGTKMAARYALDLAPGEARVIRLRLTDTPVSGRGGPFGAAFERLFADRRAEADAFYADVLPAALGADAVAVLRQALAGLLWTKQYYAYDVDIWLREHGVDPQRHARSAIRNRDWFHLHAADIVAMPDKWEYPWSSWDVALQAVPLALVDGEFAKGQLELLLREDRMHPNGQLPAFEWDFGAVNPPVHAWAALLVYELDARQRGGGGDVAFLRQVFQKLLLNVTWWSNRRDADGSHLFAGGVIGVDNFGAIDRRTPIAGGGRVETSGGIAWMAFAVAQMLTIALELGGDDPGHDELALKFVDHFLWLALAMDHVGSGNDALWDESDGFFYDVVRLPGGTSSRPRIRSVAGLLPLAAVAVIPAEVSHRSPALLAKARAFLEKHPEAIRNLASPAPPGVAGRRLLAVVDETRLRRLLRAMLDEDEFLSAYGIRSLSRRHAAEPVTIADGLCVGYDPGHPTTGDFGGNAHWRGPIWLPVNALLIRALLQHYRYYGDALKVECPTGSGRLHTLFEVAIELTRRLMRLFLADATGRRPVHGDARPFHDDADWRPLALFHEYFDGDTGAGLGASHHTGWTALVVALAAFAESTTAEQFLADGDLDAGDGGPITPRRRRRPAF